MDVKYFGNGGLAIVLGEGDTRQVDDGRGNVTEVATTRALIVDPSWVEDVENGQLLDERPALHPDTGRPLSETEDVASGQKLDPRGGPNQAQLEAEIARLRAENESYRSGQDRGGSTFGQTAAEQQPGGTVLTEAKGEPTVDPTVPEAPEGYTPNADGTYTRQADGVRGTIDWDAKTFHPQA